MSLAEKHLMCHMQNKTQNMKIIHFAKKKEEEATL
jgi:hypothetical protein